MNINTKDIRIDKIPAGAYYIGDPCYAFNDHQQWLRLLKSIDNLPTVAAVEAQINARETAFADTYPE